MSEPLQHPRKPAAPAIVLVEPQLGENIGTTARAMANFGLVDLRVVNPREGWPNEKAVAAASRAPVIDAVRVYGTVSEAVADLNFIYATTARSREVAKPVAGPRAAAGTMRSRIAAGSGVGVLFGRERSGLTNEEVSLADAILTLPVDPGFSSLNVAQSVLIVAYEWRLSGLVDEAAGLPFDAGIALPAPRHELLRMFEHFEGALARAGFFRPPEKRGHMVLALRSMLQRAGLTEQEVRTLRGVVAALDRRPTRPHEAADGTFTTERMPGEAEET
jgi:tRNA/rRNA methyltransferase